MILSFCLRVISGALDAAYYPSVFCVLASEFPLIIGTAFVSEYI